MLSACQALKFGAVPRTAETMVADSIRPTKDDRRDIGKFIAALPSEASLEIESLADLAENLNSLFDALEEIQYAGVHLTITCGRKKTIKSDDRFWEIVSAIAIAHKSFKSESTRIGIETARGQGRIGGRQRKLSPAQISQAREMRSRGASVAQICDVIGCGRTTYYAWIHAGRSR
jgi:DNA invertase Pin-like site-specific DNA recombinase